MQGKKSFIAYSDWKLIFDELPHEDAGKLIKHIFAYVNDENPESDSILIRAVFANIKQTLKRDLAKWESQQEQRVNAGKASAVSRKEKTSETKRPFNDRARKPTVSANVTVTVTDNVNVTEMDKVFEKWKVFRKSINKPIHEASIIAAKNKLIKLSGDNPKVANEIVDESIANGYQGLFPLKNKIIPQEQKRPYERLESKPER